MTLPSNNILILGAGELGLSIIYSLAKSPHYVPEKQTLTVLLRSSSISSTDPTKKAQVQSLRDLGVNFLEGDLVNDTLESLSEKFRPYDTIISCLGFTGGKGTQLKIARAVVLSTERGEGEVGGLKGKKRFIPWQFGVDYDAIGRGSPQDLFDEQLDVRDLLRGQERVDWVIVSTGMFMSFVFHEGFGVVNFKEGVVRALGGWENRVTVMAVEDIGKVTAEIVLGEYADELFGKSGPVFVAGDTVSYGQLAEFLGRFTGREFKREVVSVEQAVEGARRDESVGASSALNKYRAVFGQGKGVAWDVNETWNHQAGFPAMTLVQWAEKNLGHYAAVR